MCGNLDSLSPGEWFIKPDIQHRGGGELLYLPMAGEAAGSIAATIPLLDNLLAFANVSGLTVENIDVEFSDWSCGGLDRTAVCDYQSASFQRDAAIRLVNASKSYTTVIQIITRSQNRAKNRDFRCVFKHPQVLGCKPRLESTILHNAVIPCMLWVACLVFQATYVSFDSVAMRHHGQQALWVVDGCTNVSFTRGSISDLGTGAVRVGVGKRTHGDQPPWPRTNATRLRGNQHIVIADSNFFDGGWVFPCQQLIGSTLVNPCAMYRYPRQ